ncbi:hypothetical protein PHMEG_0007080 [Phytophthora megakarya]|uniref:MULE transposase domain-containing protein n=1 Tax=Phytophthora megakarya TaxID=4795 RepID=A0A225WNV6_9STRA|nr:hypothetical protein PHMEG_0007080 [Phytophthora megakarya]
MHLQWLAVVENAPPGDTVDFLETFKAYRITKCNVVPCSIYMYPQPDTMFYRLMNGTSPACKLMQSHGKYQWRGQRLECSITKRTTIHGSGTHCSAVNDDRNTPLMETHKTKFVQNYAYHYKKTKQLNHDKHWDIIEFFSGDENETAALTFGWTLDEFGKMLVGYSSDEKSFVVGISAKRLLRPLDRPINTFILHLDATFKLNQVNYPVIVCGISDWCRSFHLVTLFVRSQRTEYQYLDCLRALRDAFTRMTGKALLVSTVMGDAEDAQFNAFERVFGEANRYIHLMCFYHLVAKLRKKRKECQKRQKIVYFEASTMFTLIEVWSSALNLFELMWRRGVIVMRRKNSLSISSISGYKESLCAGSASTT